MRGRIVKTVALLVPLMMGTADFCENWEGPSTCISGCAPYWAHVYDVQLGFEDFGGGSVAVTFEATEDVTAGVACPHSGSWGYDIAYELQRWDPNVSGWGTRIPKAPNTGEWIWPGSEPKGCSAMRAVDAAWLMADVVTGDRFKLTVRIWISMETTREETYEITYP